MNRNLFLIIICLLVPAENLWSQALKEIDTVLVTASNIPLKIQETGRNISIIQAEQIEALPFNSLDELLQWIPGVQVQSRGGFGVQADILLRGSTFNQVLILVDGLKMNDALTGHFNGNISVSPREIARIEILRGPAAAIYGPDAVGGVINFVTKTFARNMQEGSDMGGSLSYGDNELVRAEQGIFLRKGKLRVGAAINFNESEGESIPEEIIDTTTTLSPYNTFFDVKTVSAALGYDFNNGLSINFRSAYDLRDFNARYFYTNSTFDKSTEIVQGWWNHLRLNKYSDKGQTDINIAFKSNTDEFVFSPDFPSTNNHTTQYLNMTFNHLQELSDQFTLKAGLQADRRGIESNDRGDHQDWHTGIYAMGILQPSDQINLTGSLRLDYDENYGWELSPQVNASWVLSNLLLRGSVGRSIRAADYTERYVSNNLQNLTPGRSLGNPDLLAEKGWSEEFGVDFFPIKNLTIKATAFFRQSERLIDYVSTPASEITIGDLQEGGNYFFAQNISAVNTNGAELEAWYQQNFGNNGNLRLSLGYTYLNTSNDQGVVSVYISSHAQHLLTSQLILSIDKVELALGGHYVNRDAREALSINANLNPSYSVWHGRFSVEIIEGIRVQAQMQNIFNTQYQNILGSRMPGAWFQGGISWRIK
ncbi:MAG: TonB-dependent receptor [Bacteroidota bacterium]